MERSDDEKRKLLNEKAHLMELRVLCTDAEFNRLFHMMRGITLDRCCLFVVHHKSLNCLEESDIEEALEFGSEIDWDKLENS